MKDFAIAAGIALPIVIASMALMWLSPAWQAMLNF